MNGWINEWNKIQWIWYKMENDIKLISTIATEILTIIKAGCGPFCL